MPSFFRALHSVVHKKASIFLKPSVVILSPCQIIEHCLLYDCFKAIILKLSPDDRKCAFSATLLPHRQSCSRPCSLVDHFDELSVSSFHTANLHRLENRVFSSLILLLVCLTLAGLSQSLSHVSSSFSYLSLCLSVLCCHGNQHEAVGELILSTANILVHN